MYKSDQEVLSLPGYRTVRVEVAPASLLLDENLAVMKQQLLDLLSEEKLPGDNEGTEVVFTIGLLDIPDSKHLDLAEGKGSIYPIRLSATTILLGPLYHPEQKQGPCPRCLERRWLANRSNEEQHALLCTSRIQLSGTSLVLHPALLESIRDIVVGVLSDETKPVASAPGQGWFYALHPSTLHVQRHQLLADSSCPVCACANPDQAAEAKIRLTSRPKPESTTYRLTNPLDYRLPDQGLVNPECGMLGLKATVGLWHTATTPVTGWYYRTREKRNLSIGWGGYTTTFRTSRRVGFLEGLERYCGLWPRQRHTVIYNSYNHLRPDALDPRTCGYYSPEFYQAFPSLTPPAPDNAMRWVWGYSFRSERPMLVPEQLAYYFSDESKDSYFVYDTSSGCAIGSCLEEAILHGLLELIERDNFLIHWYARLAAPQIDPWSSRDLKTLRLLDRMNREGYDVHFFDTRLDTAIPTVVAVALCRKQELGTFLLAAGASLDPEDAIRAALSEIAAFEPDMLTQVTSQVELIQGLTQDFSKVSKLEHHKWLYGLPEMAQHTEFLFKNTHRVSVEETYAGWNEEKPRSLDLLADLQHIVNWIIDLNMDVIVVNQTAPELDGTGLQVVRVIVPGLVPIDFGWGRNRVFGLPRMRTVPRTAGYRATDFDLAELNLAPHPFP